MVEPNAVKNRCLAPEILEPIRITWLRADCSLNSWWDHLPDDSIFPDRNWSIDSGLLGLYQLFSASTLRLIIGLVGIRYAVSGPITCKIK